MKFTPYGNEWEATLKRMSYKQLYEIFGVERNGLNKTDYVKEIKEALLFRRAQIEIK